MLDVAVCTNLINLSMVTEGIMRRRDNVPLWVLYDGARLAKPQLIGGRSKVIRLSIWVMRWLNVLAAAGRIRHAFIPHHRLNRRILSMASRAQRVAYLDDGLDTHRVTPHNIDLDLLEHGADFYTFADAGSLAPWLDVTHVCPVGAIGDLAHRPGAHVPDLHGIRHVIFDSPGLTPAHWMQRLELDASETLLIEHPVAAKRSNTTSHCHRFAGDAVNSEAIIKSGRGLDFYFGETMLLYFAIACSDPSNRIYAQLSDAQRDNLVGLEFIRESGVRTGLWRVSSLNQESV